MEIQEIDAIVHNAASQPTDDEQKRIERQAELRKQIVSMTTTYEDGPAVLAIDETAIGHRRDIINIKAAPKQGKSTLISIIISCIMCGQWNRLCSETQGLRILYLDTEMKEADTQRIIRMALTMAGFDTTVDHERLNAVNLRKNAPQEIVEAIPEYMELLKPDVLIIDGILDLVNNFNDVEESQHLVKECLLRWADTYDCMIINAIHTNKTNDTHISQGHLGAMLDKKGELTLECEMEKVTKTVKVSAPLCRHTDVPTFYFAFGEDGVPISADHIGEHILEQKRIALEQQKQQKEEKELEELFDKVRLLFKNYGVYVNTSVLKKDIVTNKIRSKNHVKPLLNKFIDKGWLELSKDGMSYILPVPKPKEGELDMPL